MGADRLTSVVYWKFALGIAGIAVGVFILLNRERMLLWSQKQMRQNIGEVGKAFADAAEGKPNSMTVPGVGAVVIGVTLVFQAAS